MASDGVHVTETIVETHVPEAGHGAPASEDMQVTETTVGIYVSAPARPQIRYHHAVGFLPAFQSMLYVLIVALFVMTFTVQPIRIPSSSMEPTLLVGDFILMDKGTVEGNAGGLLPPVRIDRGDVVVFHDPVDDPSVHLVKRVIGVPGDRIHLRDGVVYRNGQRLSESYAVYREAAEDRYRDDFPDLKTMQPSVNANWWIRLRSLVHDGEVTVPPGCYFVMGDNRNDSADSRYWGFVPRDAIVGKPVLIYFSFRQPGSDGGVNLGPLHANFAAAKSSFARWDRTLRVVR
jgi:signal peptidase I